MEIYFITLFCQLNSIQIIFAVVSGRCPQHLSLFLHDCIDDSNVEIPFGLLVTPCTFGLGRILCFFLLFGLFREEILRLFLSRLLLWRVLEHFFSLMPVVVVSSWSSRTTEGRFFLFLGALDLFSLAFDNVSGLSALHVYFTVLVKYLKETVNMFRVES